MYSYALSTQFFNSPFNSNTGDNLIVLYEAKPIDKLNEVYDMGSKIQKSIRVVTKIQAGSDLSDFSQTSQM